MCFSLQIGWAIYLKSVKLNFKHYITPRIIKFIVTFVKKLKEIQTLKILRIESSYACTSLLFESCPKAVAVWSVYK